MYDTETKVDRNFMRRMISAYQQDLLKLINETPDHPGGDWAQEDLQLIEYLRTKTFSSFNQTITFWRLIMYYIQRRSINHNYLETIDEFDSYQEASCTVREYRYADYSADYYISSRCCKAWRESWLGPDY